MLKATLIIAGFLVLGLVLLGIIALIADSSRDASSIKSKK